MSDAAWRRYFFVDPFGIRTSCGKKASVLQLIFARVEGVYVVMH